MADNKPTESELEVLQILWQYGTNSVRFVNEKLNEHREVGYTTTLKIMQIMAEKNLVTRDTTQRTHIYTPSVLESDIQKNLLNSFIHSAFRGSAKKLVLQALGSEESTSEELQEIKNMIALIEQSKK